MKVDSCNLKIVEVGMLYHKREPADGQRRHKKLAAAVGSHIAGCVGPNLDDDYVRIRDDRARLIGHSAAKLGTIDLTAHFGGSHNAGK
jgi:hypothetical protein